MFGREYSNNPEILMSSFRQMNAKYKKVKKSKNNLLQSIYLKLFGIPEIGFQIRSLYFENAIDENLSKKKFSRILDAGSGIGTYSFYLAKKFPNSEVFGGDIDPEKLDFSKIFAKENKITNTKFGKFDVVKSASGKKYDFIVNIDVLEHIEDYKKVLANFHKLLNNGGYLFIHTPQPHQKRIFKTLKKWEHEDHVHEGYSHEELAATLDKLGFRILSKKQTFGFFGKLSWELNHMSFKKGFVVSGLAYPFLYVLALLDLVFDNSNGLGTAILARKVK